MGSSKMLLARLANSSEVESSEDEFKQSEEMNPMGMFLALRMDLVKDDLALERGSLEEEKSFIVGFQICLTPP